MRQYRLWAEIDLSALENNLEEIKGRLKPGCEIMAVVKANAYGHGAVTVASALIPAGVTWLGVGDSSEALELRQAGITAPILILGAIIDDEAADVVRENITPSIHSSERARFLNDEAARQNRILDVHLNIDTGMGRLGASPRTVIDLLHEIWNLPNLHVTGLCTHFSSASSPTLHFAREQLRTLNRVIDEAAHLGYHFQIIHAANSAAMLRMEESHFNMVRVGIALYGIDPDGFFRDVISLTPVLSLKTQIVYLKTLSPGTPVGYDRTYTTHRETRVATLPVGYNDGYSYLLSNKAKAIVNGKKVPVIGNVTMDYTMIDVTYAGEVHVGDEVTLIGRSGNAQVTAEDLANLTGTIPYEVTCLLGKRVRRVYLRKPREQQQVFSHAEETE
jgi:alanine racemase